MYHRWGNKLLDNSPIHQSRSEEIGDALIENVISKYCVPNCIIMDQDSAFMSSLMNFLIQEILYQNKNSGTLQLSFVTGRTWIKIIVYKLDQTFNGSMSNVTKIICL